MTAVLRGVVLPDRNLNWPIHPDELEDLRRVALAGPLLGWVPQVDEPHVVAHGLSEYIGRDQEKVAARLRAEFSLDAPVTAAMRLIREPAQRCFWDDILGPNMKVLTVELEDVVTSTIPTAYGLLPARSFAFWSKVGAWDSRGSPCQEGGEAWTYAMLWRPAEGKIVGALHTDGVRDTSTQLAVVLTRDAGQPMSRTRVVLFARIHHRAGMLEYVLPPFTRNLVDSYVRRLQAVSADQGFPLEEVKERRPTPQPPPQPQAARRRKQSPAPAGSKPRTGEAAEVDNFAAVAAARACAPPPGVPERLKTAQLLAEMVPPQETPCDREARRRALRDEVTVFRRQHVEVLERLAHPDAARGPTPVERSAEQAQLQRDVAELNEQTHRILFEAPNMPGTQEVSRPDIATANAYQAALDRLLDAQDELHEKHDVKPQDEIVAYECEFGCGFRGLWGDVAAHEKRCRARAMDVDTIREFRVGIRMEQARRFLGPCSVESVELPGREPMRPRRFERVAEEPAVDVRGALGQVWSRWQAEQGRAPTLRPEPWMRPELRATDRWLDALLRDAGSVADIAAPPWEAILSEAEVATFAAGCRGLADAGLATDGGEACGSGDLCERLAHAGMPRRAFEAASERRALRQLEPPRERAQPEVAAAAAVLATSQATQDILAGVGGTLGVVAGAVTELLEAGPSTAASVFQQGRQLFASGHAPSDVRERRKSRASSHVS